MSIYLSLWLPVELRPIGKVTSEAAVGLIKDPKEAPSGPGCSHLPSLPGPGSDASWPPPGHLRSPHRLATCTQVTKTAAAAAAMLFSTLLDLLATA